MAGIHPLTSLPRERKPTMKLSIRDDRRAAKAETLRRKEVRRIKRGDI